MSFNSKRSVPNDFTLISDIAPIHDVCRRSHVLQLVRHTYTHLLRQSKVTTSLRIGPHIVPMNDVAEIINRDWIPRVFTEEFVGSWYQYGIVALRVPSTESLKKNPSALPTIVPLDRVRVFFKYQPKTCEYEFKVFDLDPSNPTNELVEQTDVFIFTKDDPIARDGSLNSACKTVIDHINGFNKLFHLYEYGLARRVYPDYVHLIRDQLLSRGTDGSRNPASSLLQDSDVNELMRQAAVRVMRADEHRAQWNQHREDAMQMNELLRNTYRDSTRNSVNLHGIDVGDQPHVMTTRPPVSLPPNHTVERLAASELDNNVKDLIEMRLQNICVPFGISASYVLRNGPNFHAGEINVREIDSMEREVTKLQRIIIRIAETLFKQCFPVQIAQYAVKISNYGHALDPDLDTSSDEYYDTVRDLMSLDVSFMSTKKIALDQIYELWDRKIIQDPDTIRLLILSSLGLASDVGQSRNMELPVRVELNPRNADKHGSDGSGSKRRSKKDTSDTDDDDDDDDKEDDDDGDDSSKKRKRRKQKKASNSQDPDKKMDDEQKRQKAEQSKAASSS